MTLVVNPDFVAMGEALGESYRRVLLSRLDDTPPLTDDLLLSLWREIAELDRWLGVS